MNTWQRLQSWYISTFTAQGKQQREYIDPEAKPKRPASTGFCDTCKAPLKEPSIFYCKYCQKYHCSKHRAAETHDCPNPKKIAYRNAGVWHGDGTVTGK